MPKARLNGVNLNFYKNSKKNQTPFRDLRFRSQLENDIASATGFYPAPSPRWRSLHGQMARHQERVRQGGSNR